MENHKAESLFKEYRMKTEQAVTKYNVGVTMYPGATLPELAKTIWRYGMLAEIWGIVATRLSGNKVDYLENWRIGK